MAMSTAGKVRFQRMGFWASKSAKFSMSPMSIPRLLTFHRLRSSVGRSSVVIPSRFSGDGTMDGNALRSRQWTFWLAQSWRWWFWATTMAPPWTWPFEGPMLGWTSRWKKWGEFESETQHGHIKKVMISPGIFFWDSKLYDRILNHSVYILNMVLLIVINTALSIWAMSHCAQHKGFNEEHTLGSNAAVCTDLDQIDTWFRSPVALLCKKCWCDVPSYSNVWLGCFPLKSHAAQKWLWEVLFGKWSCTSNAALQSIPKILLSWTKQKVWKWCIPPNGHYKGGKMMMNYGLWGVVLDKNQIAVGP